MMWVSANAIPARESLLMGFSRAVKIVYRASSAPDRTFEREFNTI